MSHSSAPPARPLRILFVSFVGDNRWSGMGKWTHSLADELRGRGHAVTTWFADDFERMRRLGRLAALVFPVLLAVRLWRARARFDAVVVHEPSGFWYGWLRRLSASSPPMIVMTHSVESRVFRLMIDATLRGFAVVPRGSRWKAPLLRLWQSDGALRMADHIVCLSDFDRTYLVDRLGVEPNRISLMINGAESTHQPLDRRRAGGHRVLFVGGWLDIKGRFVLPPLWERVVVDRPGATLTLVGTGAPADAVLPDFAPEVRSSVRVIPRLTEVDQVVRELQNHDLFLMPSLSEGSPLALVEAMSTGLAPVASRAGGIPKIVTDDVDGLLFDPFDPAEGAAQVSRLLGDPELRARIASNAAARARQLGWDQAADVLLEAVQSALPSREGPGSSGAPSSTGSNSIPSLR